MRADSAGVRSRSQRCYRQPESRLEGCTPAVSGALRGVLLQAAASMSLMQPAPMKQALSVCLPMLADHALALMGKIKIWPESLAANWASVPG